MSTPKSKLHDFHLKLCRYASDNLAEHLDDVVLSDDDRQKYEALIEYVRQCGDDGLVEGPDMSGLLLNDEEFDRLTRWVRSLELSTVERPVSPPRRWEAVSQYHELALKCVPEIKKALPDWEKRWTTACVQFASKLERPGIRLAEGIDIVRSWCKDVCRILDAMGRRDLVPRSQKKNGTYPTPTEFKSDTHDPYLDDLYVQRVLATIKALGKRKDGTDQGTDKVIKKAGIGRSRGYEILRELQKRGLYTGHSKKKKSARYESEK